MADTKYGKLITKNKERPGGPLSWEAKVPMEPKGIVTITYLDGNVIPGAYYYQCNVVMKPTLEGSVDDPPHIHQDWDETIGLFGTNPENLDDLGGEIQITLGDEIHSITESCAIFVPRGLRHCPFVVKRVSTPIMVVTTGGSKSYIESLPAGWEGELAKSGFYKIKTQG